MARRASSSPKKTLSRVAGAVKRTAKKVSARLHGSSKSADVPAEGRARQSKTKSKTKPQQPAARKRRPQADIPVDTLNKTYTPTQTSLKAGFRADGADRQRDQEFSGGVADERWNDEDRLTNKSGDPRIGTHGRSYEPGESRLRKGRR